MPGDFQVICGSMVGENRQSPASTETLKRGDKYYSGNKNLCRDCFNNNKNC